MDRGIKAGKIFGIVFFIDYSWILIFAIVFLFLAFRYFPQNYGALSRNTNILLGVVVTILFFLSTLIHELAHSLIAKANKIEVRRITLFLFGGMSELFSEPKDAETEFKVALSGPIASIILAIIYLTLWNLSAKFFNNPPLIAVVSTLFEINLILTFFNLLPAFPLDGGRIVRSIVWALINNFDQATKFAAALGQIVSLLVIFFGILQIVIAGMWGGIWLILVGLFLIQAGNQSSTELRIKEILNNLSVENLMSTNILTLNPNLSVNDALAFYFIKYASQSFPVVDGEKVVGLISLNDIRSKVAFIDETTMVREVMRHFPSEVFVRLDKKAIEALKLMIEKNLSFLPVKDDSQIVGMITLESIANFLAEEKII